MESFRIGKWEMIGWEFLPADMAEVGANLILARKNYVKKLSTLAKDSHFELSDGKETLSLQYECAIKGDTYDEIYNNLLSAFSTAVERDRALMYTSQRASCWPVAGTR
jgi:recombinational DNA repair ATPase RecF